MTKNKGIKHDSAKPKLDLIPKEFLWEVGKVLSFGAEKYGKSNWAKGIEYSRLIAAAQRHLSQYNAGEDKDPESNISHIAHCACNLAFLLWMMEHRPDLDDRWINDIKDNS